ncbi:hypothetical protein DBV15_07597, partial [Temnothorax longispinosus]
MSLVAIIDLKAIPRLLRPPFVSPRPVAPLAVSPIPFPHSLGSAIYSYRRHIRSIISKGVSTRLGEPEEQEAVEEEDEDGGEGCFAGGKIFLTAFASPPTSDLSHSSLRSLPPFRGTFSTDACAFPDFISLGKIIVALARAPSSLAMCARLSTRVRDLYVSADLYKVATRMISTVMQWHVDIGCTSRKSIKNYLYQIRRRSSG